MVLVDVVIPPVFDLQHRSMWENLSIGASSRVRPNSLALEFNGLVLLIIIVGYTVEPFQTESITSKVLKGQPLLPTSQTNSMGRNAGDCDLFRTRSKRTKNPRQQFRKRTKNPRQQMEGCVAEIRHGAIASSWTKHGVGVRLQTLGPQSAHPSVHGSQATTQIRTRMCHRHPSVGTDDWHPCDSFLSLFSILTLACFRTGIPRYSDSVP